MQTGNRESSSRATNWRRRLQSVCLLAPFVLLPVYYFDLVSYLGPFVRPDLPAILRTLTCIPLALAYLAAAVARRSRGAVALYLVFWGGLAVYAALALWANSGVYFPQSELLLQIIFLLLWYAVPASIPLWARPAHSVVAIGVMLALGVAALCRVRRRAKAEAGSAVPAAPVDRRRKTMCRYLPVLAHPFLFGIGVQYNLIVGDGAWSAQVDSKPLALVRLGLAISVWLAFALGAVRQRRPRALRMYVAFWAVVSAIAVLPFLEFLSSSAGLPVRLGGIPLPFSLLLLYLSACFAPAYVAGGVVPVAGLVLPLGALAVGLVWQGRLRRTLVAQEGEGVGPL